MRNSLACMAVVILLGAGTPATQEPPDFSGTWVVSDVTPPTIQRAPAPAFGERFAIRQAGSSLTLLRPAVGGISMLTLPLDGSEVRTRIPRGLCVGEPTTIETAVREGNTLVISVVGSVAAGTTEVTKREIKRTFTQPDKDTVIVETRMAVQGQLQPVATVYKRSTQAIPEPVFAAPPKTAATISQVAWIGGVWSDMEKTTTIEERWTPPSGGAMLGSSRTMPNGAMSAFEFLCIVEKGGTLVYQAMPNGRSPATDFTATVVTADSITFENPAHDFPKMIRYAKKADGSLETTIAGENGARSRSFVLQPVAGVR